MNALLRVYLASINLIGNTLREYSNIYLKYLSSKIKVSRLYQTPLIPLNYSRNNMDSDLLPVPRHLIPNQGLNLLKGFASSNLQTSLMT